MMENFLCFPLVAVASLSRGCCRWKEKILTASAFTYFLPFQCSPLNTSFTPNLDNKSYLGHYIPLRTKRPSTMSLPLSYLDLPTTSDEARKPQNRPTNPNSLHTRWRALHSKSLITEPPQITAITVHSASDSRPRFEATEISRDDPIFDNFDTYNNRRCTLSSLLAIPIIGRRLSPAVETAHIGRFTNPEVVMLFQNLDIHAKEAGDPDCFLAQGFGDTDGFWHDARSVLLVREDGAPLLELHVQALIAFARDVVFEAVMEYQRSRRVEEDQEGQEEWERLDDEERARRRREDRRELVLEVCKRERFEEFFKSYRAKRVVGVRMSSFDLSFEAWDCAEWEKDARPELKDVKSPYEV